VVAHLRQLESPFGGAHILYYWVWNIPYLLLKFTCIVMYDLSTRLYRAANLDEVIEGVAASSAISFNCACLFMRQPIHRQEHLNPHPRRILITWVHRSLIILLIDAGELRMPICPFVTATSSCAAFQTRQFWPLPDPSLLELVCSLLQYCWP
jgi:hypothetical protein